MVIAADAFGSRTLEYQVLQQAINCISHPIGFSSVRFTSPEGVSHRARLVNQEQETRWICSADLGRVRHLLLLLSVDSEL
jgi:hypothetical protein